jgi:hypothetical protein
MAAEQEPSREPAGPIKKDERLYNRSQRISGIAVADEKDGTVLVLDEQGVSVPWPVDDVIREPSIG